MRDYYEILEVERMAPVEVIKKAYRQKAMRDHPDRNPGDDEAVARFKECAEAYGVLSDADKRARYDRFGHDGLRGAGGAGPQQPDLSSIFDQMRDLFGGGGGGFDDVFGQRRPRGPRRGRPGSDLRIKLPLSYEDVASGSEKSVRVKKLVGCETCDGSGAENGAFATCEACKGAGEVQQVTRSILGQFVSVQPCSACGGEGRRPKTPCPTCAGEGRVRGEEEIPISVPAGVLEGHYLTLRAAGNAGVRGGEPGDLRVEIEEKPHPAFSRDGLDLVHDLHVSVPDALLGTDVEVPTLTGTAPLSIEPGTPGGTVVRMRGRGLPDLGGRGRGDQLVRVNVWMPPKMTPEEQAAVERLRTMPSFQKRPEPPTGGRSIFERFKGAFAS